MGRGRMPIGRRDRAKQDKRERIMTAARERRARHRGSHAVRAAAERPAHLVLFDVLEVAATELQLAEVPWLTFTSGEATA
ncbi:hypothetical protein J2X68_007835 [Streptomyces sp. 3330]|uniref:hypothetical protein n=1 Tax=Streptomyces sp. 3330 TaxID=2817755 RepID=UPI002864DBE1|nr:hypothetical protein [Streptomyces sp. 3330]MDR6981093.1 hypothetical protein [Streptomyces sp. 3330]